MPYLTVQQWRWIGVGFFVGLNLLVYLAVFYAASENTVLPASGIDNLQNAIDKMYYESIHTYRLRKPSQHLSGQKSRDKNLELAFLSLLKPIASFSGIYSPPQDNQPSMALRNWSGTGSFDLGFSFNGMSLENGNLIIPATGVYFIYSSVDVLHPDSSGKCFFKHEIMRFNIIIDRTEVLFADHVNEGNAYGKSYQSNLNRLAKLNAGDQLTVKLTRSSCVLIIPNNGWFRFGVYLI